MDLPLLKLVFIKGPREGEAFEYKPGSIVRVGRIVRGNDIAIKDAGISTKHLRICSDSEKWTIQDLGSSNGTTLNSNSLPADAPFDLCHGDTIELGEYTSIQVNFTIDPQDNGTEEVQVHKLPPRPRRNNKHQAVLNSDPVRSVQENSTRRGKSSKQGNESRKENCDVEELPRRSRVSRERLVEEIVEDVKVLEKKDAKVDSRVRRTRKKDISDNSCVAGNIEGITGTGKQQEMQEQKETKGNSRVQRNRKTESTQNSCLVSVKLEIGDIKEEVEGLEGGEKRVSRRGARGKKIEVAQSSCLDLGKVEIDNTATEAPAIVPEEKGEKKVNSRITRSKKNEIAGDSYLELEKIQKEAKKRRQGRKKMETRPLESDGVMATEDNERNDPGEQARKGAVKDDLENEHGLGLTEECCDAVDRRRDNRRGKAHNESVHDRRDKEEGTRSSSALGEEAQNCSAKEGEENEQDLGCDKEEGEIGPVDESVHQLEADPEKMSLGEVAQNSVDKENTQEGQDLDLHEEYHGAIDIGRISSAENVCSEVASDGLHEEEDARESVTKSVKNMKVDLEKMTLGEWFDFLEVYLPNLIKEETGKMIEAMRSKHKRVHEYIAEQKKMMGKRPVG